jgi:hypothetical protein
MKLNLQVLRKRWKTKAKGKELKEYSHQKEKEKEKKKKRKIKLLPQWVQTIHLDSLNLHTGSMAGI